MDWSDTHVRWWDEKNMEYYRKMFAEKKVPVIIVRISSSNPKGLHIGWKERQEMIDSKQATKFHYRNVPFAVK